MLTNVLRRDVPTAACTIYDSAPELDPVAKTALSTFNEIILREAFLFNVLLIDLRLTCADPADCSQLSPIEPSVKGSEKIAGVICRLLTCHDDRRADHVVYT